MTQSDQINIFKAAIEEKNEDKLLQLLNEQGENKPDQEVIDQAFTFAFEQQQFSLVQAMASLSGDNKPSQTVINNTLETFYINVTKFKSKEPLEQSLVELIYFLCAMKGDNKPSSHHINETLFIAAEVSRWELVELLIGFKNFEWETYVLANALYGADDDARNDMFMLICKQLSNKTIADILYYAIESCNTLFRNGRSNRYSKVINLLCTLDTPNKPDQSTISKATKRASRNWELLTIFFNLTGPSKPSPESISHVLKRNLKKEHYFRTEFFSQFLTTFNQLASNNQLEAENSKDILYFAAAYNQLDLVKTLHNQVPKEERTNEFQSNLLVYAARNNNWQMVRECFKRDEEILPLPNPPANQDAIDEVLILAFQKQEIQLFLKILSFNQLSYNAITTILNYFIDPLSNYPQDTSLILTIIDRLDEDTQSSDQINDLLLKATSVNKWELVKSLINLKQIREDTYIEVLSSAVRKKQDHIVKLFCENQTSGTIAAIFYKATNKDDMELFKTLYILSNSNLSEALKTASEKPAWRILKFLFSLTEPNQLSPQAIGYTLNTLLQNKSTLSNLRPIFVELAKNNTLQAQNTRDILEFAIVYDQLALVKTLYPQLSKEELSEFHNNALKLAPENSDTANYLMNLIHPPTPVIEPKIKEPTKDIPLKKEPILSEPSKPIKNQNTSLETPVNKTKTSNKKPSELKKIVDDLIDNIKGGKNWRLSKTDSGLKMNLLTLLSKWLEEHNEGFEEQVLSILTTTCEIKRHEFNIFYGPHSAKELTKYIGNSQRLTSWANTNYAITKKELVGIDNLQKMDEFIKTMQPSVQKAPKT